MTKDQLKIEITDNQDKVVGTYIINRQTIGSNARRLSLMQPFIDDAEMDDFTKNAYFSAAALAPVLANAKGEIAYAGKDAIEQIMNDMNPEVFTLLCQHYNEINPLTEGLKAKKKKS